MVFRRPNLGFALFTLAALTLLIGLGVWQLQRLAWKSDLIETRAQRLAAPPLALSEAVANAAPDLTPVRWTGVLPALDAEPRLVAVPAVRSGVLGGTLVQATDVPGVGPILVARGWVPADSDGRDLWGRCPAAGPVLVGVLRRPTPPTSLGPRNDPETGAWGWLEPPAMATALGVPAAPPLYVHLRPEPGRADCLPIRAAVSGALTNNHLQYALTWFSLALAVAVMFALRHWRRPDKDRTDR